MSKGCKRVGWLGGAVKWSRGTSSSLRYGSINLLHLAVAGQESGCVNGPFGKVPLETHTTATDVSAVFQSHFLKPSSLKTPHIFLLCSGCWLAVISRLNCGRSVFKRFQLSLNVFVRHINTNVCDWNTTPAIRRCGYFSQGPLKLLQQKLCPKNIFPTSQ